VARNISLRSRASGSGSWPGAAARFFIAATVWKLCTNGTPSSIATGRVASPLSQ